MMLTLTAHRRLAQPVVVTSLRAVRRISSSIFPSHNPLNDKTNRPGASAGEDADPRVVGLRGNGTQKRRPMRQKRSILSRKAISSGVYALANALGHLIGSMRSSRYFSSDARLGKYSCNCVSPPCGKCDYLAYDKKYVLHPYTSMTDPLPVFPVASAQGVHIKLEDGRQLIDGMSSWWAAVHGYRHPVMDAAVRNQVDSMSHVMFGGLTHRPGASLGRRLAEIAPGDLNKVFFCDSGSVAVEVAMKMAVQHWYTVGAPRKSRFVSLLRGYHGDTFGAMSVCDPKGGMHSMFAGVLASQEFVPSPEDATAAAAEICATQVEQVLAEKSEDIAAVILEPVVQGAGGMRFMHPLLLRLLREACDRYNVLLIFDEIATGFGRTGTLFACQQTSESFDPWYSNTRQSSDDVETTTIVDAATVPDIMCIGKALTGGYMTMGATITNERVAQGITGTGGVFMHGPTFMGNPLACTTANASLDLLIGVDHKSAEWQSRVRSVRDALVSALEPVALLPQVAETRVLGAIGVCELKEPIKDMATVQRAFVEEGVWLRPFGKLLYTMPPFNCPQLVEEHVRKISNAIHKVASSL